MSADGIALFFIIVAFLISIELWERQA